MRPVCTSPLSYTPLALWPEIISIKGNVTPDLFHASSGSCMQCFSSTFTGLVLVSVQNSLFLSTEHSVSAQGRNLEQDPQEVSFFSYWDPPFMLPQPLISPQLLRAWPLSPLGIPDLGPGRGHFSSTRDCAASLPSACSFPHGTSQSESPPCGDTGCPLDRCPGGHWGCKDHDRTKPGH